MPEELQSLAALGPFKGLDYTSSDALVEPGYATSAIGANPTRMKGALIAERGRIAIGDFTPAVGTISAVFAYVGSGDGAYLLLQGSAGTILYSLNGVSTTVLTGARSFDQAVQYGSVVYTNAGQRFFPQSTQFYDWQYPAPVALNNYTLTAGTAGTMAAGIYYYTFTRITTMPDGSTSETSVDLNQYASLAMANGGVTVGSFNNAMPPVGTTNGSVVITPTNGFLFAGTNDDGTTFTTNIYRQSNLQAGYILLANVTTNGPYTDTVADATIIGNAQLEVNRDVPPVTALNRGSICIHKDRIWCFVTVSDANTFNLPQVQVWYSNVDRVWEFNLTDQVLLLQADITSQPPAQNFYTSLYGNDPKGMCEVGSILLCFKKRETWAIYGDDASTFIPRQLFGIGAVSRHSITQAVGGVFWLSENGAYFFDGSAPQYISEKIRAVIRPSPGNANNPPTYGVPPSIQTNATGSFSNLTWYLSFPEFPNAGNGMTVGYHSVTGEWTSTLEYAPFGSGSIYTVESDPVTYTGNELGAIYAARSSAPGIVDAWFADQNNDLGKPQATTWTGPLDDAGKPSFEKMVRFLTLYAPIQAGTATVTLITDPGGTTTEPFVWVCDLSQPPPYITSVPVQGLRCYNLQLSVTLQGVAGQPTPQLWGVEAWGKIARNLVIPV